MDTDLRLTGVVDRVRRRDFFGLLVRPVTGLHGLTLAGQGFDRVLVRSLTETESLGEDLRTQGVPTDRVCGLL